MSMKLLINGTDYGATDVLDLAVEKMSYAVTERAGGGLTVTLSPPGLQEYDPVLTSGGVAADLGTGAYREGRYVDLGGVVFYWARFVIGTSPTLASGKFQVTLPSSPANLPQPTGGGFILDNSGSPSYQPVAVEPTLDPTLAAALSLDADRLFVFNTEAGGLGDASAVVGHDAPFTFAEGDIVNIFGFYFPEVD